MNDSPCNFVHRICVRSLGSTFDIELDGMLDSMLDGASDSALDGMLFGTRVAHWMVY